MITKCETNIQNDRQTQRAAAVTGKQTAGGTNKQTHAFAKKQAD
jgi:hypothetical protein